MQIGDSVPGPFYLAFIELDTKLLDNQGEMAKRSAISMNKGLFQNSNMAAKPFLKWAGGKTQLLNELAKRLPKSALRERVIERYVEPFVGGGAVFFHLKSNFNVKEAYLFDINEELIVGYKVIQDSHKTLVSKLEALETFYLERDDVAREEYYYEIRHSYNTQMPGFNYDKYDASWTERAAYLIFLNKTCYNGLFRQNSKGEFNVPFGRYKNPKICDEENIAGVHAALQGTRILCGDFANAERYITKDSFVYLDPPYRPLNPTSSFTAYFKDGFDDDEQKRLMQFFKRMDKRGAKLMLSNSDPKNENPNDNFFDNLYKDFQLERVDAKRFINCKPSGRGNIKELIITNYQG